jgi:hypothetical protein
MYLQPNIKLGVKLGDSARMKFPVHEFQDSDLRLKKIKVYLHSSLLVPSILSLSSPPSNI